MTISIVEKAVTTGGVLKLSRRPNVRMNVYRLKDHGYIRVEDVGEKLLYRWNDQFPVKVSWEGTKTVKTYEPNDIIHVQTKKKVVA